MRPMTQRVKVLCFIAQFFPFKVMHVEAVRIGNWVTDGLFIFGKQVWIETDKSEVCTLLYAESELKWWASESGAFKAANSAHAIEVLKGYGMRPYAMGPYDTLEKADQFSKILGGVK